MKIDMSSNFPVFRKTGAQTTAKTSAPAADTAGKTDVIDFSRGQTAMPDKGLATLKTTILRDIGAASDAERLSALQASIRAGSYRPSTDELVDAILGK